MRALTCRGYANGENLWLEDRPVPAPGKGEVRVKVLACGANASDGEFITGRPAYGRISRWFMRGNVFGSDVVGRVEALGEGVTGLAVGDRVLADLFDHFGGFADSVVAPEGLWVPVPDELSDVDAASLPQSGTIAITAMQGRVTAGMKVLVNGGGGASGPLAIQLAKAGGAEVWAVDRAVKSSLMVNAGADHVIDFAREDFSAGAERYDLVLDLWGTRPMRRVRRVLRPGGRYMLVGGPMRLIIAAALSGLVTRRGDRKAGLLVVNQGPTHLADLMERVRTGTLRPLIGEVAALEDAATALARMGAGQVAGKLVIVP